MCSLFLLYLFYFSCKLFFLMLLDFHFYFVLFSEMLSCCSFDTYFPFWLEELQIALPVEFPVVRRDRDIWWNKRFWKIDSDLKKRVISLRLAFSIDHFWWTFMSPNWLNDSLFPIAGMWWTVILSVFLTSPNLWQS